jgi:hypothetical protein
MTDDRQSTFHATDQSDDDAPTCALTYDLQCAVHGHLGSFLDGPMAVQIGEQHLSAK